MNSVPPMPDTLPDVVFPEIPRISLKNGMTVVCIEDHHLPRVSVRLAFPLGRSSDPAESQGLAQFVLEMLKEGTTSRSSQEIAEFLDQMAIDFESEVSMEHSVISMTMLVEQLDPGLELLNDILCNPAFSEVEFEKVRTRWRGNLLSQRSDPAFLADERIFKEIYGSHPYSNVSIPIEHLERIDCELLRTFFETHFKPKGAYLLLAGAVSPDQAAGIAEHHFGEWTGEALPSLQFPSLSRISGRLFTLVDRPHSAQTKILMGMRTIPQSDPAILPLKLVNQVLGGGASSRLFLNLREDKGYTYGAYSYQKNYKWDGLLLATANVRTDATRASIEEVFSELEQMGLNLPGEEELARSKSEIIGSFLRQMETPGSIGSLEVLRLLMDLPDDYYTAYIPTLRALTPADILAVADKFLDSRRILTTVVGDRSLLENEIQMLGELRIYDAHGHRLE